MPYCLQQWKKYEITKKKKFSERPKEKKILGVSVLSLPEKKVYAKAFSQDRRYLNAIFVMQSFECHQ
jgi:hypothetical protein